MEDQFEGVCRKLIGEELWPRALEMFRKYGRHCSYNFTNMMLNAAVQGRAKEVLEVLRRHYREHLSFKHPDERGRFLSEEDDPTCQMFLQICTEMLGLDSNEVA
jgi:hypothetical protein